MITLLNIRVSFDLTDLICLVVICLSLGSLLTYALFRRDIER